MTRFAHSISFRPTRSFDPQFLELVKTCTQLSREKAALEVVVERLEAELENIRLDEQARLSAEREDAAFQMAAMADDFVESQVWARA